MAQLASAQVSYPCMIEPQYGTSNPEVGSSSLPGPTSFCLFWSSLPAQWHLRKFSDCCSISLDAMNTGREFCERGHQLSLSCLSGVYGFITHKRKSTKSYSKPSSTQHYSAFSVFSASTATGSNSSALNSPNPCSILTDSSSVHCFLVSSPSWPCSMAENSSGP